MARTVQLYTVPFFTGGKPLHVGATSPSMALALARAWQRENKAAGGQRRKLAGRVRKTRSDKGQPRKAN